MCWNDSWSKKENEKNGKKNGWEPDEINSRFDLQILNNYQTKSESNN